MMAIHGCVMTQLELPMSLDRDRLLAFKLQAIAKQKAYAQARYEWTEPQLRAFAQHQRELYAVRVRLFALLEARRIQSRSASV